MSLSHRPIIAIDGPAGAGKTTAARNLAERLDLVYLDTGATFRAIALKAIRSGVDLSDEAAIAALAEHTELRFEGPRSECILLDGEDVSEAIRKPEVARGSAAVAVHALLRERLVELWRRLAADGGVVLEGRDIGTKVFPEADVKFFLDARPDARASRRFSEQQGKESTTFEKVSRDLELRDRSDRNRAHSPLRQAPDAVLVDTTDLTPDETLQRLVDVVIDRLSESN